VAYFCERIVDRAQFVRQQLATSRPTLPFNSAGVALLPKWEPKPDYGKPVVDEVIEAGHTLLHVSARNGSSVGSWRAQVHLDPGSYRLVAKVKTSGVGTDPGDRKGGAGLRTSEARMPQKLTGDNKWTQVALDFDIGGAAPQFNFMGPIVDDVWDMDLICELRAAKGEAWFDRDSLRLLQR
jgi:hypothetical protein